MKDEKWFECFWLDLDDAVDDETALLNQNRTVEIIKRIYDQGRADQNEADVEAAKMCAGWSGIVAAIRAAGPEVWE